MTQVQRMFDGYDTGVRYVDHHIGRILERLATLGIEDEVGVIITADHGETLGELGIYCDHQTADHQVARVPMIIRWPGLAPGVEQFAPLPSTWRRPSSSSVEAVSRTGGTGSRFGPHSIRENLREGRA